MIAINIKYPDYNNSILNLANSVLKHFGAEYTHKTLSELDNILQKQYKNVVVMVFDAMGSMNLKETLNEDTFLRKHLVEDISSVFPPTTTAATTTLQSGLSPAEHSWLGWSLHFDEVNDNVNIFINTNDDGEQAADYNVAQRYIPYKNIIDKINETGNAKAYGVSPYLGYKISTFEELFKGVEDICRDEGRHYIYAYWPEPDSLMHKYGINSRQVVCSINNINEAVEELSKKLKDTVLIITADHGHINTRNELISEYDDITRTLKWMPSIEARAAAFFVKDGMNEEFEAAFNKHFANDFKLLSKEEVIKMNLFGTGDVHPRFNGFVGDYMALAIGDRAIYNNYDEYTNFIGAHAGITEKEMTVPLIIVECN